MNILLVEDHQDTLTVLARILASFGHRVQTAANMADALQLAQNHRFELLISDIGLPDGSGKELMAKLLQLYPIRGIALSGFGMDEDRRQSLEAGFQQHLIKPVNIQTLQTAIAEIA